MAEIQQEELQIDIDLVQNREHVQLDNLKCPICHNIYWDPISCNQCMNHFCRECYRRQYQNFLSSTNKKCPLCNQISETRRPVPLLNQILSNLKIKCVNQECSQIVDYDSYLKHYITCDYKMETCNITYNGRQQCKKVLMRKFITQHRTEDCEFREIKCTHCDKNIVYIDRLEHEESCPQRQRECKYCADYFPQGILSNHYNICPKNFADCKHCKSQFVYMNLEAHEYDCPEKILCCVGCTQKMTMAKYFSHQAQCPMFPIICPQCDTKMTRSVFSTHSQNDCIRSIKDNFNAKLKDIKETLDQHVIQQLQTKFVFSTQLKDEDIFISPDKFQAIVRDQKKKRKDRFALFTKPLQNNDKYRFECTQVRSEWYAIGATEVTSLYIQKKYQDTSHGSYLVSANGITYSNHNHDQNWKQTIFRIDQGDIIEMTFNNHQISFINVTKNLTITLDLDDKEYYACACLRTGGDQIKII